MARYRNEMDEERDYAMRNDRLGRERPWNYNDPHSGRSRYDREYSAERFGRGRFGERADYGHDEPRYYGYSGGYPEESYGRSREQERERERDYRGGASYREYPVRSRLRCRDIMTRDLAVATRETTLREISIMMKNEDTGVIPVVEYDATGGNGRTNADSQRLPNGGHHYGRLVGLVTDRDIVIRAVAEDKDCSTSHSEEIWSTDLYTARVNDRVVDVIRKMGNRQVRRIPVVSENGYLRGMISLGDIARETEEDEELGEALGEISREPSFWSRLFG